MIRPWPSLPDGGLVAGIAVALAVHACCAWWVLGLAVPAARATARPTRALTRAEIPVQAKVYELDWHPRGARAPQVALRAAPPVAAPPLRPAAVARPKPAAAAVPGPHLPAPAAPPAAAAIAVPLPASPAGPAPPAIAAGAGSAAGAPAPGPAPAPETRSDNATSGPPGAEIATAETVEVPPRPLDVPQPRYPEWLRRRGVTATIRIVLVIGEDGRVRDAQVRCVAGSPELAEPVREVVRQWRFAPARHKGRAVAVRLVQDIEFRLDDG